MIKIEAILDFDSLYKFEMTFDLYSYVTLKLSIGDALSMNPYDKTNELTLYSEKSEHPSIFDPCGTLKVNGGHLGKTTICGISGNYDLFTLYLNF